MKHLTLVGIPAENRNKIPKVAVHRAPCHTITVVSVSDMPLCLILFLEANSCIRADQTPTLPCSVTGDSFMGNRNGVYWRSCLMMFLLLIKLWSYMCRLVSEQLMKFKGSFCLCHSAFGKQSMFAWRLWWRGISPKMQRAIIRGIFRPHLQSRVSWAIFQHGITSKVKFESAFTLESRSAYSALKMEAMYSSETSVNFQRISWRYMPEETPTTRAYSIKKQKN
jgi:hypothetical protein